MINVFEVFLPQLLLYPNPTDPLNGEAASLLMREPEAYNSKVRGISIACLFVIRILMVDYVKLFAKESDVIMQPSNAKQNSSKSKSTTKAKMTGETSKAHSDDDDEFLSSSSDDDDSIGAS